MKGILLVNKPANITSHDVVVRIRRLFRTKKVGHAGTLDPFATGLLILCLGDATRVVEYFVNLDKEYVGVMKLGESTDTQDCTGHVLERRTIPDFLQDGVASEVSEEKLQEIFARFVGNISQIPPMFSARKVRGKRLFELARKGEIIERTAKDVRIDALDILDISSAYIRFRVVCSKGTYIRTLAHDIGETLGCGAHLSALVRTRIGSFSKKEAFSFEQLSQMAQQSEHERALIPVDKALAFLPAIELNERSSGLLVHGTKISLKEGEFRVLEFPEGQSQEDQVLRVYNTAGKFLALARGMVIGNHRKLRGMLQPLKVFVKPEF